MHIFIKIIKFWKMHMLVPVLQANMLYNMWWKYLCGMDIAMVLTDIYFFIFVQEKGDNQPYCWRNVFSCINLLRILNKLTKWKHSRTMVCIGFISILKPEIKLKYYNIELIILPFVCVACKEIIQRYTEFNCKTQLCRYIIVWKLCGDMQLWREIYVGTQSWGSYVQVHI